MRTPDAGQNSLMFSGLSTLCHKKSDAPHCGHRFCWSAYTWLEEMAAANKLLFLGGGVSAAFFFGAQFIK